VAELVAELWNTSAGVVIDPAPELHEAGLLALDATKAERALGWRDQLSFREAMSWTVDWAERTLAGEDPRQTCASQVETFRSLRAGE
jgi:CDP-glucose 4,6-dehydratase